LKTSDFLYYAICKIPPWGAKTGEKKTVSVFGWFSRPLFKKTKLVVDQYGHALQSVTGATRNATRTLHDLFLAALEHSLREAGIKFKGGGHSNGSCKHIFSHLTHAFVGADDA
jgi:hypothetical protein